MNKILRGGFFASKRNQVMCGVGLLSALCAYFVGDSDLFTTLETIIALGGMYLFHKTKKGK